MSNQYIQVSVIAEFGSEALRAKYADRIKMLNEGREDRVLISLTDISESHLSDLADAYEAAQNRKMAKVFRAIIDARKGGNDGSVPSFKAFYSMLTTFLQRNAVDGWMYLRGEDGLLYPHLILDVKEEDGENSYSRSAEKNQLVRITYGAYSPSRSNGRVSFASQRESVVFYPSDISRRKVRDILESAGVVLGTQELNDAHDQHIRNFIAGARNGFTKQYRCTGTSYQSSRRGHGNNSAVALDGVRVIHDMEAEKFTTDELFCDSCLFEDGGRLPKHALVSVFDLKKHDFFFVNAQYMTPYVYDKGLANKLVLPESHHDLLELLTTDFSAFTADFVEGKVAGNVILCRGIPGIGKTLTAEVYSEIIERPMYNIHSGSLGVSPDDVKSNLEIIFARVKRWDCVMLLDEAEVFVRRRGDNIIQNAIVAEFLRSMEYFDGLVFLTTNRSDEIDDAFISRCAAIIDYTVPGTNEMRRIWELMFEHFGHPQSSDELINELMRLFPDIAPRDIKHLMRLVVRNSKNKKLELSASQFRQMAMFRAIHMVSE